MARHVWHGLLGSCTLEAKRSGCPAPLRTSHAQEQTGPQDLFLDATLHASPGAMPAKQQGTCRKMASRVAEPKPRVSPSSRSAFCTLCWRPGGRGRGRAGRSRSVVQGVGGETARARVHRRRASPPCLGAPELKQQAQQRCLLWPSLHLALLRSAPRTSLPRLPHPRHPTAPHATPSPSITAPAPPRRTTGAWTRRWEPRQPAVPTSRPGCGCHSGGSACMLARGTGWASAGRLRAAGQERCPATLFGRPLARPAGTQQAGALWRQHVAADLHHAGCHSGVTSHLSASRYASWHSASSSCTAGTAGEARLAR